MHYEIVSGPGPPFFILTMSSSWRSAPAPPGCGFGIKRVMDYNSSKTYEYLPGQLLYKISINHIFPELKGLNNEKFIMIYIIFIFLSIKFINLPKMSLLPIYFHGLRSYASGRIAIPE